MLPATPISVQFLPLGSLPVLEPSALLIPGVQVVLLVGFLLSLWKARQLRFPVVSSEERFCFLFDHASDPVILIDGLTGEVIEVNPSFLFWSGFSREEALATSLVELTRQDHEAVTNDLRTIQERGIVLLERRPFFRRTGEVASLQVTGLPVEGKNGVCILLFLRDLSEQDRAAKARAEVEQALQRSHRELTTTNARLEAEIRERERVELSLRQAKDEADRATVAKSAFLATMSHEIRTPMNGVIGMTELLMETDLSPEQREYVEAVHSSGELLLDVINDVLDFSKIEAGRMELESAPFDLREEVAVAVKGLAVKAHQKRLELVFEVEPEVPETVVGDPVRFRQILLNLVGNAIKFTAHGEVVVLVGLNAPPATDSATLHVQVRDTGIGIDPERQQAIFESFTQATGDSARKYGGSGLGLAICRQLVEQMGGRIWVESKLGTGSVFHFTVEVGCPDLLLPDAPGVVPVLAGKRTLVVDDNGTNRFLLERWLGRWGLDVTCAAGAKEAMAALEDACRQNRPYPIALVDVQMPHMDGFQLIREIRKHPEWNAARILLLSSANAPGFTAKAQGLGIAGFMLKPILPDELRRSLVRLCSGAVSDRLTSREARGAAPGTPGTPLRILLAEDNPVSQALARRMLEKRGHQVITANDGAEVVARWQAEPIDVILMDGLMPGTDGFEATRLIRTAPPLPLTAGKAPGNPRVPIVAMTACALKGDRERCLEAGMDDYVAKPVTLDQLETAMLRAMDARRRDVQAAPRA